MTTVAARREDRPSGRPQRGARGAAGFTLLEASVALVVVGLGIAGAVAAASHALRTQAELGRRAEALALTEERLLELEALPRDSLPAQGRVVTEDAPTLDGRRYVREAAVRREGETALWRVTAVTRWGERQVRLATVLHRPAPDPFEGRAR